MIRRRAVVIGSVQGVGFRWSTQIRARDLGLAGYVRNRWDGAVEVEAEGTAADVTALIDWLHQGPPSAWVTRVEVSDVPVKGETHFKVA